MHRKEVTHSNGSYEKRSRGRIKADNMGQGEGPTVPLQSDALEESYFRLMTIKHSISKIEWASNDYITQLSSTSQGSSVPGSWVEDRTEL